MRYGGTLWAAAGAVLLWGCAQRRTYTYEAVLARHGEGPGRRAEAPAEIDLSKPISVWDAIRAGLGGNPEVAEAEARIARAKALLDEAAAALLPSVEARYGYTWADQPSMFLFKQIDGRELSAGVDFNHPGRFTAHTFTVTARQSLFSGGRNVLGKWMAELGVEQGERARDAVENDLIHAVIRAYYDARAAGELLETARQSVRTVEAQLRERRAKFEAGAGVLKSEVLSLEVRVAEAREREIAARNARRLALTALAALMGLEADAELRLSGEDWEPVALPPDYKSGLAVALERRPELEAARLAVRRSAMAVDAAKAERLPQVGLVGRLNFDDEDLQYSWDDRGWMLGVDVRYGVFEGGRRRAAVRRARARLRELLDADRRAVLAVQSQVRQAYLRLDDARARLAVARKAVEQAKEGLDLVRSRYEEGRATVTRYLEAELALSAARTRATRALFDLKRAKADVGHALGLCLECARRRWGERR